MKRYVALLALGTLGLAGCSRSANVEQERSALLAADREWSQTTKDPDKFISYFASDATAYPQGMPAVTGTDAIRAMFTGMSSAPGFALTWTPGKAEVAGTGDLGYTTGTYEANMGAGTEKGKYVTIWKKQADGTWKATEDIFNADAAGPPAAHVMVPASTLKWVEAPPSLPLGARIAVVSGDPSQAQPFVIRAQVPAGYKVAPHWHPGTENLTILSGTAALGMGEKFDQSAVTDLPAGSYAALPAEMRHYFLAKTATTFQVHGMGPFVVNYVNPADDPSKQTR